MYVSVQNVYFIYIIFILYICCHVSFLLIAHGCSGKAPRFFLQYVVIHVYEGTERERERKRSHETVSNGFKHKTHKPFIMYRRKT